MSNYSPYDASADFWKKSKQAGKSITDPKYMKQNRPHLFIEKPALFEKLPDLTGKKVLALGCGSGEEVELLALRGATDIVGIDISSPLIELAKEQYPDYVFKVMDAEHITLENESFDYVMSSLMLDYFPSWDKVLAGVFKILKPGGTFLFSTVHPVKWSAKKLNDADGKAYATLMGFQIDQETGKQEILGDYLYTVELNETWANALTVKFYSRSVTAMFRDIRNAGFTVTDIYEPKAIPETKEYDQNYWEVNQHIPNFIFFECVRAFEHCPSM